MKEHTYQICTRCVMDTTDPDITFNEVGECNLCSNFLEKRAKHNYNGAESDIKFRNIVSEIKKAGKGKEYDCVIGLSGGIDSSYAAYIAKKNGLR
ncbi:MAG: N-acetyl sugar amidotransferase, partial [Bacteroidetes bacterium]|nr:N-acetyl sugar amidotransferase [Bacteroidota bacterium]